MASTATESVQSGDGSGTQSTSDWLPSAAAYAAWVRSNPESARRVEELLRLSTLIAPGGTSDVVYSAANALTVAHDMVLDANPLRESGVLRSARGALAVLGSVDVMVEVLARAVGSSSTTWTCISAVELLRVALRTYVLAITRERLLLHGGAIAARRGLTAEDLTPSAMPAAAHPTSDAAADDSGGTGSATASGAAPSVPTGSDSTVKPAVNATAGAEEWWRGALTGVTVPLPPRGEAPPLSHDGSVMEGITAVISLLKCAATALRPLPSKTPSHVARELLRSDDAVAAAAVVYPSIGHPGVECTAEDAGAPCADESGPLLAAGEMLHILRPLVYVMARRATSGRSIIPLALAVGADALSARCTTVALERAAGFTEPFVPSYLTETIVASGAACWRLVRGEQAPEAAAADAEGRAVDEFTLPTPPHVAAGVDSALFDALRGPRAGWVGVIIRFGLWLLSTPPGVTRAEAAELNRRRLLWLLHLLRAPLLKSVTLPATDVVVRSVSWVPLLGALLKYMRDLLAFYAGHYFYVSGSQ